MKKYVISVTIGAIIFYGVINYTAGVYNRYPPPTAGYVASRRVSAALKFHGIKFAECNQKGKLNFDRDGKTCKLFTKAFKQKWRRQRKCQ